MKTNRQLFKVMLLFASMLCLIGCTTSDSEDAGSNSYAEDEWGETGSADSGFQPVYKDYIGTNQFRSDYDNFLNLLVMGQAYKDWMFISWNDTEKGPFGRETLTEDGMEMLFALEEEISDLYDNSLTSIERLDNMEIFYTETPGTGTRGIIGTLQKGLAFFGIIKSTGEDSRKTALGVLAQNPDEGEELFKAMNPKFHYGEDNYAKWVQNLNEGKYDNHGNTIYRELYNTSQELSVDNKKGKGFYEYASENKLTPNDRAASAAPGLWQAGVNFATSIPSSVIAGKGLSAGNVMKAVEGEKAAQDGVKIGLATFGGSYAAKSAINMGSKDRSGTEAERKARQKELEEASKAYIEDIKNKSADAANQTGIQVKDDDKNSPATTAVVINDDNGRINVGASSKVPMGIDDDGNVTVTGVDNNGDKFTQKAKAEKGKTTTVNGSSTETEKIAGVPYANVEPSSLSFKCDKSSQSITVNTNYKYLRAKKTDKEVDWLSVKRSKKVVTVSVEENEDDNERRTSILIEFSNDKATVAETVMVPVSQQGNFDDEDDLVFDLSFIDLPTFRIDYINVGDILDESDMIGDFFLGYLPGAKKVTFDTKDLQITKESDDCYLVTGKYQNVLAPDDFGHGAAPNAHQKYRFEVPYGYYMDISFRMVALEFRDVELYDEEDPSKGFRWIKLDRMAIKDLKVNGYSKILVDCSYNWCKVTGYDKDIKYTSYHVDDWYDKYFEFSFEYADQFGADFINEKDGRHTFVGEGYFTRIKYNMEEHYITKDFVQEGNLNKGYFRSDPIFDYMDNDKILKDYESKGVTIGLSWK